MTRRKVTKAREPKAPKRRVVQMKIVVLYHEYNEQGEECATKSGEVVLYRADFGSTTFNQIAKKVEAGT